MMKQTYTDWFTAVFKPKADLVFLTTGNSQIKLGSDDSDFEVRKNIEFDCEGPELNNVDISDPEGIILF